KTLPSRNGAREYEVWNTETGRNVTATFAYFCKRLPCCRPKKRFTVLEHMFYNKINGVFVASQSADGRGSHG
ncbi:MAG: hypothetical protein E6X17_17505, partial [Sporomusaceae bacterium]|nr:hypothetical protein [Sporomusaceae bacterium]